MTFVCVSGRVSAAKKCVNAQVWGNCPCIYACIFICKCMRVSVCVLYLRASLLGCLCECVFVYVGYKAALTSSSPPRVDAVAVAF